MNAPGPRALFLLSLLLLAATAVQGLFAHHLRWRGGQPDFIFTVALVAALLSGAGAGSVFGFLGGLFTASIAGSTVGTFLVTRTIAGFVAGWFSERMFRGNILVIMASVLCATGVSELLYILAVPRVGFTVWLPAALIGACWNAVLAVPAAYVLQWAGWGEG